MTPASRDQDELNKLMLHPKVWPMRMPGVIFINAYPLLFFPRANGFTNSDKEASGGKNMEKKMR